MIGTGSLLSSNIVLTSAHTILALDKNKRLRLRKIHSQNLVFYTQICGELDPAKKSMVTDYRICSQYEEKVAREFELVKEKKRLKELSNLDKDQT